MGFQKTCPVCKKEFTSLEEYMNDIKNNHKDIPPEVFVKKDAESKWSFRENKD